MVQRHSICWKADKRYTVNYKDGEEYDYRIAEIKEFIQLKEIPIGEIGYQFLRESEGYYYLCEVEKIILEKHVALYPLLEELMAKRNIVNVGCRIIDNTTIVWDR